MPYTFPVDTNNKAGAVKAYGATEFVVPTQDIAYAGYSAKRNTLVANTNAPQDHGAVYEGFTVQNLGTVDAYVRLDAVATVDGAGTILIPFGTSLFIPVRGQVVHWISTGTPKVQSIGVK